MKKLLTAVAFASACSFAFAAGADAEKVCESKAIDKNGKPLHGAAKSASMKKCMADAKPTEHAGCADKAVDKNGKPLAGAARSTFMKKCVADSGAAK